ncbi:hypothetical protein RRF57_000228 [Xylaria bambusicola]|uniref:Uncharacterized protein n=1 Tax=Xylaria bambusicola TaxID=326684 RepID=A0AAN7YZF2_9PEZI
MALKERPSVHKLFEAHHPYVEVEVGIFICYPFFCACRCHLHKCTDDRLFKLHVRVEDEREVAYSHDSCYALFEYISGTFEISSPCPIRSQATPELPPLISKAVDPTSNNSLDIDTGFVTSLNFRGMFHEQIDHFAPQFIVTFALFAVEPRIVENIDIILNSFGK